jgi:hypothetical protein
MVMVAQTNGHSSVGMPHVAYSRGASGLSQRWGRTSRTTTVENIAGLLQLQFGVGAAGRNRYHTDSMAQFLI